jgi:hypothetical protein
MKVPLFLLADIAEKGSVDTSTKLERMLLIITSLLQPLSLATTIDYIDGCLAV